MDWLYYFRLDASLGIPSCPRGTPTHYIISIVEIDAPFCYAHIKRRESHSQDNHLPVQKRFVAVSFYIPTAIPKNLTAAEYCAIVLQYEWWHETTMLISTRISTFMARWRHGPNRGNPHGHSHARLIGFKLHIHTQPGWDLHCTQKGEVTCSLKTNKDRCRPIAAPNPTHLWATVIGESTNSTVYRASDQQ